MNKKESIVLVVLILVLVILNVISYVKREQLKKSTAIIIEEVAVKISINNAWTEELQVLPGIGPALADRIITYREKHGDFECIEDLKNVRGIGDKVLQRISPFIKLQ